MTICNNCTQFVADYLNRSSQVDPTITTNTSDANTTTSGSGTRRRRSVGVQQLTEADKQKLEEGESLEAVLEASALKRRPACGLQLYTCKIGCSLLNSHV